MAGRPAVRLGCVVAAILLANALIGPRPLGAAPMADVEVLQASRPASAAEVQVSHREDRGEIAILELAGDYTRYGPDGQFNVDARSAVARTLYASHPDEYDFLIVFTSFDFDRAGATAYYLGIANDVSGIGHPLFDHTDLFGSGGRLQGWIEMGPTSQYAFDPMDPGFDRLLVTASHEILHRWSGRASFLRDGEPSSDLHTAAGHWNYLLDSDASVLYGNDWQMHAAGQFRSVGTLRDWSDVDRYLAGFGAAESVAPLNLLHADGVDGDRLPNLGAEVQATVEQVPLSAIIDAIGPRSPAYGASQRDYRFALLLVVRPGEEIAPATLAGLEAFRRQLAVRLMINANGQGVFEGNLRPADPGTGSDGGIGVDGPSGSPADIGAGLRWLRQQQRPDGSWSDRAGTAPRDTALALELLLAEDPSFSASSADAALGWFEARGVESTEAVAHLLNANRAAGRSDRRDALDQLAGWARDDGGWGLLPGSQSTVVDTVLAIKALAGADVGLQSKAVLFLHGSQNADGSWGVAPGGPGRTLVTAQVLAALADAQALPAPIADRALVWLGGKQNSDGGFGDSPSSVHDSAGVLESLNRAGLADRIDRTATLSYLSTRQSLDGSFERSVSATVLALEALLGAELPNLVFSRAPVIEPDVVRDGDIARLVLSITNQATATMPASSVRASAPGGIEVEARAPTLPPGGSTEIVLELDTWDRVGQHDLNVVLDAANEVVEINESDNSRVVPLEVEPAGALPDLALRLSEQGVRPALIERLPGDHVVEVLVRNLGLADAVADLRALGRTVLGDREIASQSVAVGPRGSLALELPLRIEQPLEHEVILLADPADELREGNEGNNSAALRLPIRGTWDAAVANDSLVLQGLPVLGSDIAFDVRVDNRGTEDLSDLAARIELTSAGEVLAAVSPVMQITAGGASVRRLSWRVDRVGPIELRVVLDPGAQIQEFDESNNEATLALSTLEAGEANLAVSFEDLSFVPKPALEGAGLEVRALIRSSGGAQPLEDVLVRFSSGSVEGPVLGDYVIAHLAAGQSEVATVRVDEVLGDEDLLVFVRIDPADAVVEPREDDNVAFRLLPVLGLPDLAVSSSSVSLSPAQPSPGQSVELQVQVANLGEQSVAAAQVRASVISGEQRTVVASGQVSVDPLGTSAVTLSWVWEGEREAIVELSLDPEEALPEADEANNQASLSVLPGDHGLAVSQRYLSPNGDGRFEEIRILVAAGLAAMAVEARDEWGALLKRWEVAGQAGAVLTWDGRRDDGAVAADGSVTLAVIAHDGTELASARVVVDTNRSPILGSSERARNLTCELPTFTDPQLTVDDEWLYGAVYDGTGTSYGHGLYRYQLTTGRIDPILSTAWFGAFRPLQSLVRGDGRFAAVVRSRPGRSETWLVEGSGSAARQLGGWTELLGFSSARLDRLVAWDGIVLKAFSLAQAVPAITLANAGNLTGYETSPDQSHLLVGVLDASGLGDQVLAIDLESLDVTPLAGATWPARYSPGSDLIAANSADDGLILFSADGGFVRQFSAAGLALGDSEASLEMLGWASSSEVALGVGRSGRCGGPTVLAVAVLNVDTGLATVVARTIGEEECHRATPEGWALGVSAVYRRDSATVDWISTPEFSAKGEELFTVRLNPAAGSGEPLDRVTLRVGELELPPDEVLHGDESGSGERSLVELLAQRDGLLVPRMDQVLELGWRDVPPGRRRVRLTSAVPGDSQIGIEPGVNRRPAAVGAAAPSPLFQDSGKIAVDEVALPGYGTLVTLPAEQGLLWLADSGESTGLRLRGGQTSEVLAAFDDELVRQVSRSGRVVTFESHRDTSNAESSCYRRGSVDLWSLSSYANLTADLTGRPLPGGGYQLSGAASDANLAGWQLSWADEGAASSWHPIGVPSDRPAYDEPMIQWTPPGEGRFRVRLEVEDRAGNRTRREISLTGSAQPMVAGLALSRERFSPNGDGVAELVQASFQVYAPVHVTIVVRQAGGGIVAELRGDYDQAGEYSLSWDGRSQVGATVGDGTYTLELAGSEETVVVDTTLPNIRLHPVDPYGRDDLGYVLFAPGAVAEATDDDPLLTFELERLGSGGWALVDELRPCRTEAGAAAGESCEFFVGPAVIERRFRVSAEDGAGNRTVDELPRPEEKVILVSAKIDGVLTRLRAGIWGSSQPVEYLKRGDASEARLLLGHSAAVAVEGLAIRAGRVGLDDEVNLPILGIKDERGVPLATPPPGAQFWVSSDLSSLSPDSAWVLCAEIAAGGRLLRSNCVGIAPAPGGRLTLTGLETLGGLNLPAPRQRELEAVLGQAQLTGGRFVMVSATGGSLSGARLRVRSDEDDLYRYWRTLEPLALWPDGAVFRVDPWLACTQYELVADGTLRSPLGEELEVRVEGSPKTPCLRVRLDWVRQVGPGCNQATPEEIVVEVRPQAFRDAALQLLSLSRPGPGGEDVLASWPRPVAGQVYALELPIGEEPAGPLALAATLSFADGEAVRETMIVPVDRSPANLSIEEPADGEQVCGGALDDRGVWLPGAIRLAAQVADDHFAQARLLLIDQAGRQSVLAGSSQLSEVRGSQGGQAISSLRRAPEGLLGEYRLRLEAGDPSGTLGCREITFSADGVVEGLATSASLPLFSPNGDERLDEVRLDIATGEPIDVVASVCRAVRSEQGLQCVGESIRNLAELRVLASEQVIWDGRTEGGQVAEDGLYGLRAAARDHCGNLRTSTTFIELDNSPPELSLAYPRSGDPLGLLVEIAGTVTDDHLQSLDVLVVPADGSGPAVVLARRSAEAAELAVLARWNTFGVSGAYSLQLRARDRAENVALLEEPLAVDGPTVLLEDLSALPDVFSPNADGRRDLVQLRLVARSSAFVTVNAQTANGQPVRVLAADRLIEAGATTLLWDGSGGSGPAADGRYRLVVHAELAANRFVTQDEMLSVVLDRTAPLIAILRPGEVGSSAAGVQGTVADSNLVAYDVELALPDQQEWRSIGGGSRSVAGARLANLSDLPEGEYVLRVRAVDAGETRAEVLHSFRLDDTPPTVAIVAPLSDAVLGDAAATVRGLAQDENLANWQLSVGVGVEPPSFTPLGSGEVPDSGGIEYVWQAATTGEGARTLRLKVDDAAGNTASAEVVVQVDATPPIVAWRSPEESAFVVAPINLVGTVDDLFLIEGVVLVAAGEPATASRWETVGRLPRSVRDDVLMQWAALPPDGVYTLRLEGRDAVGHVASATRRVVVDTTPPAAPVLAASREGDGVRLNWPDPNATDVARYRLERNGALLAELPPAARTHLDQEVGDGRWVYRLRAVDHAGHEGSWSPSAEVVIDRQAPEVEILSPRDGARLRDELVVVGTAWSAADFAEYRLLRRSGAGGDWQVLRRSPVPIVAGELGRMMLDGLLEGSVIGLRLEAEDISGNVAVAEVELVFDSQPPLAPSGVAATLLTNDVDVTWLANTEPDLLGYVVYRNGQPLGLPSGGGDPLAGVVTATRFVDVGVPDGTHSYVVVAVDRAANWSGPSAPSSVAVDRRAPDAIFALPAVGARFEGELYVLATTPDRDIAEVELSWRSAGVGAAWTLLRRATAEPFDGRLPGDLAEGSYELRALARDLAGRVDPSPAVIRVEKADLTPPEAVATVDARANGGVVLVSWEPSAGAADYEVWRRPDAEPAGSGSSLLGVTAEVSFEDSDLDDGTWWYRVTAVDAADNRSAESPEAEAEVYSLAAKQPYSPTADSTTSLHVVSPVDVAFEGVRWDAGGAAHPLPAPVQPGPGEASWPDVVLTLGENRFGVVAVNAGGDRSRLSEVTVVQGERPPAPTRLSALAVGETVQVDWTAVDGALGYLLLRGGEAVPPPRLEEPVDVVATSELWGGEAAQAVDGSADTAWLVEAWDSESVAGQWLELGFAGPVWVQAVELTWGRSPGGSVLGPTRFDLEAWDGRAWVPLFELDAPARDFASPLNERYLTSRLRLLLRDAAFEEAEPISLAEWAVYGQPFWTTPSATDEAGDGLHRYEVAAISQLGLVGGLSEPVDIGVGDREPPAAVLLSGAVTDSLAELSWTASESADAAAYLVERDGAVVAQYGAAAASHEHREVLANGSYRYRVFVQDRSGLVSEPSNEVVLMVAVAAPRPPQLTVTADDEGGALLLQWTSDNPGDVAYRVYRRVDQGDWSPVARLVALAHHDRGLENGRAYHYRVTCVDLADNEGPPSNEVSAVPMDLLSPAPPLLHAPTVPGRPWRTEVAATDLVGWAEPGATVLVQRSPEAQHLVTARPSMARRAIPGTVEFGALLSPDGRFLYDAGELMETASGTRFLLPFGGPAAWTADSRELLFVGDGGLQIYRLVDQSVRLLASTPEFDGIYPTADPNVTLTLGWGDLGYGLYRVDLTRGELEPALVDDSIWIDPATVAVSSDGVHVAFVRWIAEAELVLFNLQTQDQLVLDSLPVEAEASFSANGRWLAWTSRASGREQIAAHSLTDGVREDWTGGELSHSVPRFAPDGERLAWLEEGRRVKIAASREEDPVDLVESAPAAIADLQWTLDGQLLVVTDEASEMVVPAGQFVVPQAGLVPGLNTIAARASDDSGNVSAVSQSIELTRVPPALADLSLGSGDLLIVPTRPRTGDLVRATVWVRNEGSVAAGPTVVELFHRAPTGAVETLRANLPGLVAGDVQAVDFLVDGLLAGRHTLVAMVDPDGAIAERNESNNSALGEVEVAEDDGVRIEAYTDRFTYAPGELVRISVKIENAGEASPALLAAAVRDATGYWVADVAPSTISLPAGGTTVHELVWDPDGVFAGAYSVQVTLLVGPVQAVATTGFRLGEASRLSAEVYSPRATYRRGDVVDMEGRVIVQFANGLLDGLEAQLAVETSDRSILYSHRETMSTLTAGAVAVTTARWSSGAQPAGALWLRLRVFDDGQLVAEAVRALELLATGPTLIGAVEVTPTAGPVGQEVDIAVAVENRGDLAEPSFAGRLEFRDGRLGPLLESWTVEAELAAGEILQRNFELPTATLSPGSYQLQLVQGDGEERTLLATGVFALRDHLAPEVLVAVPRSGEVVSASAELVANAWDAHSAVALVEGRLDGGPWNPLHLGDQSGGLWSLRLPPLADGGHDVEVRATDAWGNESAIELASFSVDSVAPEILISGVEDGGTYPSPVQPVIEVRDLNLASTFSSLDGVPFSSGAMVTTPGPHVLSVLAQDAAGNHAERTLSFSLGDATTPPQLLVADMLATEGDELLAVEVPWTLDRPTDTAIEIHWELQSLTGSAAEDWVVTAGVLAMAAGQRQGVFTLGLLGDQLAESGEEFSLHLASGGAVETPDEVRVSVQDDDVPGLRLEKVDQLLEDRDGDDAPSAGDRLGYRLSLRNTGSSILRSIVVTDSLPVTTTLTPGSLSVSDGVGQEGSTLTVSLAELPIGSELIATFSVDIAAEQPGDPSEIVNQAAVETVELPAILSDDPDRGGPADPTMTPLGRDPIVGLEKRVALALDRDTSGGASPGDQVSYELTVRNQGYSTATLVLRDELDSLLHYVPGSLEVEAGGEVLSEVPLEVGFEDVQPGDELTVVLRADLELAWPSTEITVENQAFAAAAGGGEVPSDDPGTAEPLDPTSVEVFVVPQLQADGVSAVESDGSVTVRVELDRAPNHPLRLVGTLVAGSASAGEDFVDEEVAVTVEPGGREAYLTIGLLDDAHAEREEHFTVVVTTDQPGTRALSLPVTIRDDDGPGVRLAAQLSVSGSQLPGGVVTYALVLANEGPLDQPDMPGDEVVLALPPELEALDGFEVWSVTGGGGQAQVAGSEFRWSGSIPAYTTLELRSSARLVANTWGRTIAVQARVVLDGDSDGVVDGEVLSDDPSTPEAPDPTRFQVADAAAIPSLGHLGMAVLAAALALVGARRSRRPSKLAPETSSSQRGKLV